MIKKIQRRIEKKKEVGYKNNKMEVDEGDSCFDLWDENKNKEKSKSLEQFKTFSRNSIVNVKSVILPLSGQSYNPSAKDHKEVIKQVVNEEIKQI